MSSLRQTDFDDYPTNVGRQIIQPTLLDMTTMDSVECMFDQTKLPNNMSNEELLQYLFPLSTEGPELSVTPSPRPSTAEDNPIIEQELCAKHDPVVEDKPIMKQTLDVEHEPHIKQVPEHFHLVKHNSLPSQLYPTPDQDLLSVQGPPRPQSSPPYPSTSQYFGYPRYCASPPPIDSATLLPAHVDGYTEAIYPQSIKEPPPMSIFSFTPPPLPIQAPFDYLPPPPNKFTQSMPLTSIQSATFPQYHYYQQQHMSYPYPTQWEPPSYPEASTSSAIIRHKKRRIDSTPPYKRESLLAENSENLQVGIDPPKPIKCRLPKVGDQGKVCNELCANAVELQRHLCLKGAHGIVNDKRCKRRYRCTWEYCTTEMGGSGNLLRHIKEVHGGEVRSRKSRSSGEGRKKSKRVAGNENWNGLTAPR